MKKLLVVLLLLASYTGFSKPAEEEQVKAAISSLNKALLEKDTVQLETLLENGLTYGHSSGWIETKQEVINDLYNGKLVYQKIENVQDQQLTMSDNTCLARMKMNVSVVVDGNAMELRLAVFQVWQKAKGKWKLIARQSVQIK